MIRFGIMGAGDIAKKFCAAVKKLPQAEVAAVSSKDLVRAMAFAEENGLTSYYDQYELMLQREDIDAVYIATTHNFHYENILLALSYGKHVLCEKCMVLTAEEARTVFKTAKEKGLFVMEAMWSRFIPAMQKAKKWIEEGLLGELVMADYALGFFAQPDHRALVPHLAGGAMYDLGVYAFEGLTYLIDKPLLDIKSNVCWANGVDMTDSVLLEFEDHLLASFRCTIAAPVESCMTIYGTKGRIVLNNPVCPQECRYYGLDGSRFSYQYPVENGFEFEITEAVSCIEQGLLESSVIPHSDTIRCAELFDCVLRGKKVL